MCVGAIINARISKVYFGARDLKAGALGGLFNVMEQKGFNHYFEYKFLNVSDCGKILSDYFKEKRAVFQQKKIKAVN
jgi:tRNA(adenine34) deaminase